MQRYDGDPRIMMLLLSHDLISHALEVSQLPPVFFFRCATLTMHEGRVNDQVVMTWLFNGGGFFKNPRFGVVFRCVLL